ncbi:MAG: putative sugar O-methyltransferase [Deltaproteobacteria bacterium]|nr:putative sugar O-methyltransferase [Deltaproteobacteria bacterium]
MWRDQAALEYLEKIADMPEASRSVYWEREAKNISVNASGEVKGDPSGLGGISTKIEGMTGLIHRLGYWVLHWPFRRMGRKYASFGECKRLGHLVAKRRGWHFTKDMIRQTLSLALIREHFSFHDTDETSVVIGDGWGTMASLLLLAFPERKVVLVNLNKPLLIDLLFVRNSVPNVHFAVVTNKEDVNAALKDPNINVIAVQADNASLIAEVPIGLAINILSMQEMTPPMISEYFRLLRCSKGKRTAFYCSNKIWKRLYDGTEVWFHKYPWREEDEIVVDELCKWSQLLYKKKPPFWYHRPYGRLRVWQRLTYLENVPH